MKTTKSNHSGYVTFVGAGPGDPDLITVKGLRALQTAQVLVYDRLVSRELVEMVPRECTRIYVGKRKHLHVMEQQRINQLLIAHGKAGRQVVRLKGGDSFIFGRGGEEIDALEAAGIEWRVVPGVTAATGAAAELGMALTHRDHSQALTFITAQRRAGGFEIDWTLAMRPRQSVVFYMGLTLLGEITQGLLSRGMDPATPFAVIAKATQIDQRVIVGCIADIQCQCAQQKIAAPALLVMGECVRQIKHRPRAARLIYQPMTRVLKLRSKTVTENGTA